ncbi:protein transport protein Sec16A isoform X2 [Sorex fumeus]|uniref:protein transport protein Sec16A isoform X2 n=1 Tax=Sorex fumeus TaxID=62283 RepID=UPI0024AE476E|nr:protein transport protein Sec16A isoform X2 [Sorex fumeus]
MQPPPQAIPSGVVGPPPAGNPPSTFWSSSPYRRQVAPSGPAAPLPCPVQPVTDPFAFSRQALQGPAAGSAAHSGLPGMQGLASSTSLQHPGQPLRPLSAAHCSHGPLDPLPRPLSQPKPETSAFSSLVAPSAPPGLGMNRVTEAASSSETPVQTPLFLPQYIPTGPDMSVGGHNSGNVPGPDRPCSGQNPHAAAAPPAAPSSFPPPAQPLPGQWGPAQGGPPPSSQHSWPCPEGPVPITVPPASRATQFPASLHQGHEPLNPPVSVPAPGAGLSGNPSVTSLHPENAFRRDSRAGPGLASQELRPAPGMTWEQMPAPALANPAAQGNSSESHLHPQVGARLGHALPQGDLGALSMFFQGGETENEENLSYEKPGSAGPADLDGVTPNPGPGHPGSQSALLRSSNSESAQQGGDAQAYFSQSLGVQHERQTTKSVSLDPWGDPARVGAPEAASTQYENVEDLEFVQNQEVLPSEPLGVELAPSDQPRYGPLPGPTSSKLSAPDAVPHPVRPDSASSGHSSRSLRTLPGAARPQDLVGTFIQQEVGKPEDEAPGSFFKQIDSSPIGGEVDETPGGQSYQSSLSQPPTPSPPKPTGVFQTSANSSFEPVRSHLVGVKPVEADRANMVGEVRDTHAQQKQSRAAAAPPDASPGNLEQPPDNMETLYVPRDSPLPPATTREAGHGPSHAVGLPLDSVLPTPEKRPLTRAQGAVNCESPATTLWAQNELPDFGGNVLLAPAAPVLHVPVNPRPLEVIQPPDEGVFSQQPSSRTPLQGGDALGASENLENPPKMGEEEALPSQASFGSASLSPSLSTDPLADQLVLTAQLSNSPVSSRSPAKKSQCCRDVGGGRSPGPAARLPGNAPFCLGPYPALPASLCHTIFPRVTHCSQVSGPPEMVSNLLATLLLQLSPLASKNLLPENPKMPENLLAQLLSSWAGGTAAPLVPPACSASGPGSVKASASSNWEGTVGALDFSLPRTLEIPMRMHGLSRLDGSVSCQQSTATHPGPRAHNPDPLYQQVTRDAQEPQGPEKAQLEPAPPPLPGHRAALSEPSDVGCPLGPGQSQNSAQPPASLATSDIGQQLPLPRPPLTSSVAIAATASSQATVRPDQQWPQSPPPDYYYYRPLYDGYQPQYPSPYPPDPAVGPLYYQDVYGMYDPRYRPYDSTASAYAESYRYPEPERPSSRASHSSDRPPARREYPEGYYSSKGWSSQSDYYASYYSGQYDYGDLGRWDRYHYRSRFRDPRTYDQRYWHDAEYDMYRKDSYAHGDRSDKYDDPWRYDPRFTGSFDDDPEPRRDPYGEEADRHSVHSEHSAQSLRSRRSSLSSHSHQSQMYRGHHVTAGSYDAPPPPGSFHGDYTYGVYGGAFPEASWSTVEQAPSRPTSPEKFPVPHLCARFGPGGQLIKVMPNLPSEGQPALVEIHSMESLLQHTPEQEEMRSFPGPLGKDDTHKVDVINFAQKKATKCLQDENLLDKESASLLWNFIVLLCRQNGTVVGTDIAELLLRDHKTVWLPGKSPNEANLIDFTHEAVERVEEEESVEAQLSFLGGQPPPASTLEKEVERFRELLLYGRKKDALESAMKNALWGHALLLASKMDSRTHAKVMTRFANSLPINDPLQTVYQLMSGRMPAASTCCGDEKWGDWRPHLAMVLSNLSSNMDVESRTMVTMGDTLASKGLLDAAHFCYLMAQLGFGVYTKKSTKLVLIGSNHSLPFPKFATNEAIQRTEAYEYAQSLGAQTCTLPNFQVFKFIYSCRLAEMGLATQAFHYCEVIAQSILAQPHDHSPVLISQLVQVASQLRLFDPQLKERPEEESFVEPAWLTQLQRVDEQVKEGSLVWRQDAAVPKCRPSSPSSDVGLCEGPGSALPSGPGPDNPLLAPLMPAAEPLGQSVRLLPSAPQRLPGSQLALPTGVPMFPVPAPPGSVLGFPEPSVPDPTALYPGPGLPPGGPPLQEPGATLQEAPGRHLVPELREGDVGGAPADLGPPRMPQDYEPSVGWEPPPPAPSPIQDMKRAAPAKKEPKEPKKSSEPWFFSRWLYGKKRTEAYLPDDKNKSIVWDEKKNRWVDVNEPEEEKKAPPPPPTSLLKAPQAAPPGPGGAPRASVNMFSRKAAGSRARYVDVLNPGGTQRSDPALAPADFFAPLAPLPIPALVGGTQAGSGRCPCCRAPPRGGSAFLQPCAVYTSGCHLRKLPGRTHGWKETGCAELEPLPTSPPCLRAHQP